MHLGLYCFPGVQIGYSWRMTHNKLAMCQYDTDTPTWGNRMREKVFKGTECIDKADGDVSMGLDVWRRMMLYAPPIEI